ncbi:DUF1542 domain-containing protein [Enterococcus plantarum]|uniref:DUF1542 domain-containing protein n=1 Tax=Enterococcus plantarum TaxID=1077675 RepID=UPI0014289B79|nr:DUF1542 domain-containing protein [Enterococcus plantarum]
MIVYAEEIPQELIITDKGTGTQYEKYLDPDTDNYITIDANYNRYTSDENNLFIIEVEKSTGTLFGAKLTVDTGIITNRVAIPTDGTEIVIDDAAISIGDNGTTFSYILTSNVGDPFVKVYQNSRTFQTGVENFGGIGVSSPFGQLYARYIPKKKTIEIRYQDEQGNTLYPTLTKEGFDTIETYSIVGEPIEIPGYTLIQDPKIDQVQISQDDSQNIVSYIYAFDAESHKPTIDKLQEGDTVIIGTGVVGDKIIVSDKEGNIVGEGVVGQDGTFTIPLTSEIQEGDIVTATPETNGQKGTSTEIVVEKNSLLDQKAVKKAEIDSIANDTKTAIDNDPTLTTEEKENQKTTVDSEAEKAKNAIDNSTTADAIQSAGETGKTVVKDQYKPGTSLDDQKAAKKAEIDSIANDTKTAIDNDKTLTTEEKENQKTTVDSEAEKAKNAIDNSTTADTIQSAGETGKTVVKDQYKPGTSLDDQKAVKKAEIDSIANDTKTAIDNDPTLITEEKENQKAAVDSETEKAKNAIDNSTTADAIHSAGGKGRILVKNQYKPGTSLDDPKEAKKPISDSVTNDAKSVPNTNVENKSRKSKNNLGSSTLPNTGTNQTIWPNFWGMILLTLSASLLFPYRKSKTVIQKNNSLEK